MKTITLQYEDEKDLDEQIRKLKKELKEKEEDEIREIKTKQSEFFVNKTDIFVRRIFNVELIIEDLIRVPKEDICEVFDFGYAEETYKEELEVLSALKKAKTSEQIEYIYSARFADHFYEKYSRVSKQDIANLIKEKADVGTLENFITEDYYSDENLEVRIELKSR